MAEGNETWETLLNLIKSVPIILILLFVLSMMISPWAVRDLSAAEIGFDRMFEDMQTMPKGTSVASQLNPTDDYGFMMVDPGEEISQKRCDNKQCICLYEGKGKIVRCEIIEHASSPQKTIDLTVNDKMVWVHKDNDGKISIQKV